MLTRPQLNLELEKAIQSFDSKWEKTFLTCDELLEKLRETLNAVTHQVPTFAGAFNAANLNEEQIIIKRTENLRIRLREILEGEKEAAYRLNKRFCDKIFDLQILLARAFPINDKDEGIFTDPITLDQLEPNAGLVFMSSGQVFQKESAIDFYNSTSCRNADGEYVDLNRSVISLREHASQIAQGINLDPIPSESEKTGRRIGTTVGKIAGLMGCFIIGLCTPAAVISPALILGAIGAVLGRPWWIGFFLGYFAAMVVGTALAFACPPLMSVLVAAHVISSSTALMASTTWITSILPPLLPVLTLAATYITSAITGLSVVESFVAIASSPFTVFVNLGASIGSKLGRAVDVFSKHIHSASQTELEAEQQNLDSVVLANDPLGVPLDLSLTGENVSSHQRVISILGANTDLPGERQPQGLAAVDQQMSLPSAASFPASVSPEPAASAVIPQQQEKESEEDYYNTFSCRIL